MRSMKPLGLVLLVCGLFGVGCAENAANDTPGSWANQAAKELASPSRSLEYYIASLRRGDLEGVRRVRMHAGRFQLPGPVPIDSFEIERQDTLTAAQAAESTFTPPSRAGDVVLDVCEYIGGGEGRRYTYYLTPIGGAWLIYAHSAWGVDVIDDEGRIVHTEARCEP